MKELILLIFLFLIGTAPFPCNAQDIQTIKKTVAETVAKTEKNPEMGLDERINIFKSAYDTSIKYGLDSLSGDLSFRLALRYRDHNSIDSAKYFFYRALEYTDEKENPAFESKINIEFCSLMDNLGKKDSMDYFFDKGYALAELSGDSAYIAIALREKARQYMAQGNYPSAIENFKNLKQYYSSNNNNIELKNILNLLGIAYFKIQYVEAARSTMLQGLAIEDEPGQPSNQRFYNNLGRLYLELLNNPDSAIYYYQKSAELALQQKMPFSWLVAMLNTGNVYEAEKKPQEARDIYFQVLRNDNISDFFKAKVAVSINLGVVEYQLGNYQSASFYINEGIKMAKEGGFLEFEVNAMKYKLFLDARFSSADILEENFNHYQKIVDSLYSQIQSNQISELKVQYETEKAAQENESLKEQNQLNKAIIKKQRIALIQVIISLVVLIVLLALIFNLYKKQQKLTQQLRESRAEIDHQKSLVEMRNKKLRQTINTKDKLLSIIAHDLKSPLSTIHSYLTILEDDSFDFSGEQFKDLVRDLKLNVENTTHLMANLLEWAQNQRNGISSKPQQTDLLGEAKRIEKTISMRIREKKLAVNFDFPENSIAWCDTQLYRNALLNLLNNAVKFTPKEGEITVQAKTNNDHYKICVIDNGVGIEPEHLDDIFDIDSNYHTDGTEEEKGTGLGLAMCKEYVKAMGGDISVESTPGKGSVFCFTIPSAGK